MSAAYQMKKLQLVTQETLVQIFSGHTHQVSKFEKDQIKTD